MKGLDVVARLPYVDSTRMGAAGASYGGYMIYWMAGHTDRFKALVSHDGIFNLQRSGAPRSSGSQPRVRRGRSHQSRDPRDARALVAGQPHRQVEDPDAGGARAAGYPGRCLARGSRPSPRSRCATCRPSSSISPTRGTGSSSPEPPALVGHRARLDGSVPPAEVGEQYPLGVYQC